MTAVIAPPLQRYGVVAIALHWLLALLIIGNLVMGLYMHDLPFSIERVKLFNWHKWEGITILVLSMLRLLWRWTHAPPPLPLRVLSNMPQWQRGAHRASLWTMYALFFIVPLLGWAYSTADGMHVVWFGEDVPLIKAAQDAARDADIFIIIGTSLSVYPAAGLLDVTDSHIPKFLIDPGTFVLRQYENLHHIQKMLWPEWRSW